MKKPILYLLLAVFTACTSSPDNEIDMPYSESDFEGVVDGRSTRMFTLQNNNGMVVTLTNYGAKIISIYAPDRNGQFADVVLGFNSIGEYQKYGASHGAVVGPFANRIANAGFTINGETYSLPVNNGQATLHSGPDSWYRKAWDYEQHENVTVFTIESPDGEFGFPGNKKAKVTYTLTNEDELKIEYEVTTDKATHINLTNHSYFNLRGEGNGDILGHELIINAFKATPVADAGMIPTGEIQDIRGTVLDFSTAKSIGEHIDADHPQLNFASGYDINYVINREIEGLAFAANAYEPESGRMLEVFTTEPGIQLYTGNHMKGIEIGNSGKAYTARTGFCLETQHFPDSPNQPAFPSTLLDAGEVYKSSTIFAFSVR